MRMMNKIWSSGASTKKLAGETERAIFKRVTAFRIFVEIEDCSRIQMAQSKTCSLSGRAEHGTKGKRVVGKLCTNRFEYGKKC